MLEDYGTLSLTQCGVELSKDVGKLIICKLLLQDGLRLCLCCSDEILRLVLLLLQPFFLLDEIEPFSLNISCMYRVERWKIPAATLRGVESLSRHCVKSAGVCSAPF